MRSLRPILFVAILGLCVQPLTGCSDDDDDTTPPPTEDIGHADADASGGEDTADIDEDVDMEEDSENDGDADIDEESDIDEEPDADASNGPDDGLPTTCEGDCREQTVTVEYDGETGDLSRGGFGLTAPELTDSGEWEFHIEIWEGGPDGCPVQSSPSQDWLFLIGGFGLPQDDTTLTKADDEVFLTFMDNDGRFTGQVPFVGADTVSLTPVAMRIDTDLVADGTQDEDGFIAMDITATFDDQGETSGRFYAQHCVSMDVLGPTN